MLEQTFKIYKTEWPNKNDESLVEPVNETSLESLEVSIEVQEMTNGDISQISSSAH
jgi:hypothetical protein